MRPVSALVVRMVGSVKVLPQLARKKDVVTELVRRVIADEREQVDLVIDQQQRRVIRR